MAFLFYYSIWSVIEKSNSSSFVISIEERNHTRNSAQFFKAKTKDSIKIVRLSGVEARQQQVSLKIGEITYGFFAFRMFAVLKLFARVVRWRYWKQLQRSERRRTANPYGFYIT